MGSSTPSGSYPRVHIIETFPIVFASLLTHFIVFLEASQSKTKENGSIYSEFRRWG
jgi:hypothetical protein